MEVAETDMIDDERKVEVCSALGFTISDEDSYSWIVWTPRCDYRGRVFQNYRKSAFTKKEILQIVWEEVISTHDLYLHKKGGIYRKQDERPVLDTDLVIVNYEHIHPHERAPGCRLKSEWETPGRFVKITE